MEDLKFLTGICLPFTAGIALCESMSAADAAFSSAAAVTVAAILAPAILAAAAVLSLSRVRCIWAFPAMLFACGCFCSAVRAMCTAASGGVLPHLFGAARLAVSSGIERIPFRGEGTSALIKAFLLGDRSGLAPDVTTSFRRSGGAHLLALSGLHLGVLYAALNGILRVFGNTFPARRARCAIICSFALSYTLMAGAAPSLVRALLFILLREAGKLAPGRSASPARTLMAALVLHLAISPSQIASPGFQLSYLAMCGITLLLPRLKAWYPPADSTAGEKLDPARRLWNAAALCISCQAFTAPVSWLYFGSLPAHFLLANLIAAPLATAAIGSGALCTALSLLGAVQKCPAIVGLCDLCCECLTRTLEIIAGM